MCIFCKIVNGEIPNNTVHESDHFLAFHDLHPKAPIHILIIPKQHVDCFQDVTAETMGALTEFVQEVATKVGMQQLQPHQLNLYIILYLLILHS